MKRKRFSVEQIVAILKQAETGMPVSDLIRQIGIAEQTCTRWKKRHAVLGFWVCPGLVPALPMRCGGA